MPKLTLEQFVGSTPLVRLQRIPGRNPNVLLAKLEASVKARKGGGPDKDSNAESKPAKKAPAKKSAAKKAPAKKAAAEKEGAISAVCP